MAFRLRQARMNARVLTVFALVSLPLLALVAIVTLGVGQAQLRSTFGMQLSEVAEQTVSTVDAYLFHRFIDVSLMGRAPIIREAAARASAERFDAGRMREIDRQWQQSGGTSPEVAVVTGNPAARFLRDQVEHDSIYREVLLTDRYGRLVAASGVTTDYDQADEDWWVDAWAAGPGGRVSVTDVRWDESARVFALEIAVPVPMPSGDELAGVLKVVADIREMLAFVLSARIGVTGEATLVRPDGSIVLSQRPRDPEARFFAATLLRERLLAVDAGALTYNLAFTASDDQGARYVIGVAPSQLGMSYPSLSWLVAVSQADEELFAPVRAQAISLLSVIAIATMVVLVFALWFSMRLAAPPVEIDMKLVEHPPVARIADEETVR